VDDDNEDHEGRHGEITDKNGSHESTEFHVIHLGTSVQQTSRKMGILPIGLLESALLRQHTPRVRRTAPWLL
jgi:hypothetical protein